MARKYKRKPIKDTAILYLHDGEEMTLKVIAMVTDHFLANPESELPVEVVIEDDRHLALYLITQKRGFWGGIKTVKTHLDTVELIPDGYANAINNRAIKAIAENSTFIGKLQNPINEYTAEWIDERGIKRREDRYSHDRGVWVTIDEITA